MNILNFVFIGLIFLSLAVIVFIFGKNIKRIKEISVRNPQAFSGESENKRGFLSRISGSILKFFKRIFVSIAEWIIKYAKKLLHMVHFWLITIKREKKGDEDLDEREAKEELLSEEQKNLNNLIHDGLGSEDDGIEVNFISKSLEVETIKKNNELKRVVVEESQVVGEVKIPDFSKEDVENESSEQREGKVRRFFSRKKNKRQDKIFEDPESEESKLIENQQEFDQQNESEVEEKSFFKKLFSKFSKNKDRENIVETEDNNYDQAFSDEGFSDGVVKVQDTNSQANKNGGYIEGVVPPSGFMQENDLDDDLGVDRKILEKKILQKITKDPKNVENYRQLGELYIKMRNYKDAMDAYKYIIQILPRDVDSKRKIEKIKLLKRVN